MRKYRLTLSQVAVLYILVSRKEIPLSCEHDFCALFDLHHLTRTEHGTKCSRPSAMKLSMFLWYDAVISVCVMCLVVSFLQQMSI